MVIKLGTDPWSDEYWVKLADLSAAIADLGAGRSERYMTYWMDRTAINDPDRAAAHAGYIRTLYESIRDDGYKPDAWMDSSRDFDLERGQGPLTVNIGPDGTIFAWDGSHRACICRVLDLPVEPVIYQRSAEWQRLKDANATLYQPFPHPDFAAAPMVRKPTARITEIMTHLRNLGAKKIVVAGACYGYEVAELTAGGFDAIGIEPHADRYALLESWSRRVNPAHCAQIAVADYHNYGRNDAVLGLSVYHHAATSLDKWIEICRLLADARTHFVELPPPSVDRWHGRFKQDCRNTGVTPARGILRELKRAGGYNEAKIVYTDGQYEDRQTWMLTR